MQMITITLPTWLYLTMAIALSATFAYILFKVVDRIERPNKRRK